MNCWVKRFAVVDDDNDYDDNKLDDSFGINELEWQLIAGFAWLLGKWNDQVPASYVWSSTLSVELNFQVFHDDHKQCSGHNPFFLFSLLLFSFEPFHSANPSCECCWVGQV